MYAIDRLTPKHRSVIATTPASIVSASLLRQDVIVDCRDGTASDIRQYTCYGVTDDSAKDATAPAIAGTELASSNEF